MGVDVETAKKTAPAVSAVRTANAEIVTMAAVPQRRAAAVCFAVGTRFSMLRPG